MSINMFSIQTWTEHFKCHFLYIAIYQNRLKCGNCDNFTNAGLCLGSIPGDILLKKHPSRGTLLSQQSLAMSKHTMFIGKQGEDTQQRRRK